MNLAHPLFLLAKAGVTKFNNTVSSSWVCWVHTKKQHQQQQQQQQQRLRLKHQESLDGANDDFGTGLGFDKAKQNVAEFFLGGFRTCKVRKVGLEKPIVIAFGVIDIYVPGTHLSFVFPPKQGLFQSKQGTFGFQVYIPAPSKGCQMVPKGCQFTSL